MSIIKKIWIPVYTAFLIGYTSFALLDAFVIPSNAVQMQANRNINAEAAETEAQNTAEREKTNEQASAEEITIQMTGEPISVTPITEAGNSSDTSENSSSAKASNNEVAANEAVNTEAGSSESTITDSSYSDDNISISIKTVTQNNTQIYVADVVLTNADYLKTAVANGTFGRNITQKTSDIASENNAILAINGDYYGFRDSGYVMREGSLYRSSSQNNGSEDLVIYSDGTLEVINEDEVSAEELKQNGAVQLFSFGPGLIENGEITVDESSEVDRAKQSNPRTAIGQISPLHYVFVVSDGRTEQSEGLTLLQLAEFMEALGCQTAYNLDGGGSSTMYFNGKIINNPTDGHKNGERKVSDIVYIGE